MPSHRPSLVARRASPTARYYSWPINFFEVFYEEAEMLIKCLKYQIYPFLKFLGRSVWLLRGMAMIPFRFRASLGILIGGMF